MTPRPVLTGLLPGVTATVSSTASPLSTEFGFAVPVPEGFVGSTTTEPVTLRSSMPTHSSLPTASVVMMRI